MDEEYRPTLEVPLDLFSELIELRGRFNAAQDYVNKSDGVFLDVVLAILGIDTIKYDEKCKKGTVFAFFKEENENENDQQ